MWKVLAALAAGWAVQPAWGQTPPPAEAFGRVPAVQSAEISPDGAQIAILGGSANERAVSFTTIDRLSGMAVLKLGDLETEAVRWAGNDHVLVRAAYWRTVAPRLSYRLERNIAVTRRGKAVSRLLENSDASGFITQQPVLRVLDAPEPTVAVLGLDWLIEPSGSSFTRLPRASKDTDFLATLYLVDVQSGRGRIVERGRPGTSWWEVDAKGRPRVRIDIDPGTQDRSIYVRPQGTGNWTPMIVGQDEDAEDSYLGYSEPEDALYFRGRTVGGAATVVRVPSGEKTGAPVGTPVKGSDVRLVWDEPRQAPVGIVSGEEKPRVEWLDPELATAHKAVSAAFKNQRVDLMSWARDRTRFVVRVSTPNTPPAWYLYDKARKEVSPLGEEYPELKGAALGRTRWITYKARDGLEIPAYVTLPPGAPETGGRLPLVVLPHGGPAARDDYDFDFLVQFLASRGYAVLQPQFRGSGGFGREFERAGRREWGGKIQTDLLDGIAHLAAQGVVDPKRVCIAGASFGGYAALAGATLHPGSYRCAISVSGVSDLPQSLTETFRASGKNSGALQYWRKQMGSYGDAELLRTSSPARRITAATPPILLIHGEQDTVVPITQSERMRDALAAAGKPAELIVLPRENHYFAKSASRTRMLQAMEGFLRQHLPAG